MIGEEFKSQNALSGRNVEVRVHVYVFSFVLNMQDHVIAAGKQKIRNLMLVIFISDNKWSYLCKLRSRLFLQKSKFSIKSIGANNNFSCSCSS